MNYETRTTKRILVPEGVEIFSELVTDVEVQNVGAGEFVTVSQEIEGVECKIQIDPQEWPKLRALIDEMIASCKKQTNP